MPPQPFRQLQTVEIRPSINEIAEVIVSLGSDEQALLISRIADLSKGFAPFQLQHIMDDHRLTDEGRHFMSLVGDYAHPS